MLKDEPSHSEIFSYVKKYGMQLGLLSNILIDGAYREGKDDRVARYLRKREESGWGGSLHTREAFLDRLSKS